MTITSGGRTQTATGDDRTRRPRPRPSPCPSDLAEGPATIEITYTGILNDKLRGFYISKANGRKYAVTQMEATDARRAFPSFDEPALQGHLRHLADGRPPATRRSRTAAVVSDTPGPEPGKHTVTFARDAEDVDVSGGAARRRLRLPRRRVRRHADSRLLDARQARAHRVRARGGEQQLKFYNDYFGIKYPFGKLDIIGVPDFAAGAMENAGAITFRERLLLVDPRAVVGIGTRRTSPRSSRTRSRTSGSATW